jgi:hypothetical protein
MLACADTVRLTGGVTLRLNFLILNQPSAAPPAIHTG